MSAYATLVVGVPHDDVIKTVRTERTETRYNEKTGEPYLKMIGESKLMMGNRELSPNEQDDLYYTVLELKFNMERFSPDCESSTAQDVIGVAIAKTKDICGNAKGIWIDNPEKLILDAVGKVLDFLNQIGIDTSKTKPRLCLMPHASY